MVLTATHFTGVDGSNAATVVTTEPSSADCCCSPLLLANALVVPLIASLGVDKVPPLASEAAAVVDADDGNDSSPSAVS